MVGPPGRNGNGRGAGAMSLGEGMEGPMRLGSWVGGMMSSLTADNQGGQQSQR